MRVFKTRHKLTEWPERQAVVAGRWLESADRRGREMNADDVVKAVPEIAKGMAALGAAIPFNSIVKRMLGPAADELAEMWRDRVRLYRYERQLKCVEKAEKMAQEAGFTPQAVPPKILFPLLEGASFEENDDLHTMWAALLANAASRENVTNVGPRFVAILKQMAPDEAALLKSLVDSRTATGMKLIMIPRFAIRKRYRDFGFDEDKWEICLDNLLAERLLREHVDVSEEDVPEVITPELKAQIAELGGVISPVEHREWWYSVSPKGLAFVRACRPPQPQKKG